MMEYENRKIIEFFLGLNLNECSQSISRELAMAFKKVAIYSTGHPVSIKSLEKPWMIFGQIFKFKKFVNFDLLKGNLYVLNISQPDNVFSKEIIKFMQIHDIKSILINESLTSKDLMLFSDLFVKRPNPHEPDQQMSKYLKDNGIISIAINTEFGFNFFENNRQYRGDVDGDFSVRNIALDQISEDVICLAELVTSYKEAAKKFYVDFQPDIVEYLLPEKMAAIPVKKISAQMNELFGGVNDGAENYEPWNNESIQNTVLKILKYRPDKEILLKDYSMPTPENDSSAVDTLLWDDKKDTDSPVQNFENALERYYSDEQNFDAQIEAFKGFSRLFKTGYADDAIKFLERVMERLVDSSPTVRQRSLNLVLTILENYTGITHRQVIDTILNFCIITLRIKHETFEYSEIIWQVIQQLVKMSDYEAAAELCRTLASRKHFENSVTVYDSVAIKQVYSNLNRMDFLKDLVSRLVNTESSRAVSIKDIFESIGSEEAASALIDIISHPKRSVRQQALKILTAFGKPSVKICSQVIMDDSLFERELGRYELPDESWYIIRNAIFVLGKLEDADGIIPLRLRINDNDIRVRREIISSLEKIGGEDACDLLFLMIDDPIHEIAERAIITISLVGSPEVVPLLVDAAKRNPSHSVLVITALGKIGGEEARQYLNSLLNNEVLLNQLVTGQTSKENLQLAIVRALGKLDDSQSIKVIKEFKDKQSTTQKIFFKHLPINKVISEIISRKEK